MRISVTDAKAQLTELVRRSEAGDEIVLTRRGKPAVRLQPVTAPTHPKARRKLLEALRASGAGKARTGASKADEGGARSQDFLYGADGLPRRISIGGEACIRRA
jgi:prevent-host-death family protein